MGGKGGGYCARSAPFYLPVLLRLATRPKILRFAERVFVSLRLLLTRGLEKAREGRGGENQGGWGGINRSND